MRRLLVVFLLVGGVVTACGGDATESFLGECTIGGVDVTTTLVSCDAALEEGRKLAVENGLALADAPASGIDAVLAAHCMDLDAMSAQSQQLQDALRVEVCV